MTQRQLTKARAAEVLEQARMDIAILMASTIETQQQLHRPIGITGELYEGITNEEAPDIEVQPKVVRSA